MAMEQQLCGHILYSSLTATSQMAFEIQSMHKWVK